MKLIRATSNFSNWGGVHALIAESFAYMTDRLGHPPKATQLTIAQLAAEADTDTVFLLLEKGDPIGCLFCRPSRDHDGALYLGKLAVAARFRGGGLARQLIDAAAREAHAQGMNTLTLDTGIELTELHAAFQKLGFSPPTPQTSDPGVVTMMRPVRR